MSYKPRDIRRMLLQPNVSMASVTNTPLALNLHVAVAHQKLLPAKRLDMTFIEIYRRASGPISTTY